MPNALCKSQIPQYRSLFPDWSGPRPLRFFLLENLLEARRESVFPTNIAGPDEDVNVYLANLLTDFLGGNHSADIIFGAGPLFYPPAKSLGRRRRAGFYQANADHRLLMLGLFDRGEALRRRNTLFRMDRNETRRRDLDVAMNCYDLAADLLENRQTGHESLVPIWRKLADNFEFHVQIISTMAVGRLGLGARLNNLDLQRMIDQPPKRATDSLPQMDQLLDLLLEMRQPGGQKKRAEVIDLALRLNLDPQQLLKRAG